MTTERRYDIDWIRVIAIGLLIIYHIGIAFQPWGVFIGFIQNNDSIEKLWTPMSMMNIWRIPLLFWVSGMGVAFAIRKRNWKQLIIERSQRILLPFLFGIFAIVPIHQLIWQNYYSQELNYAINPVHLWFLANIFIYTILLSPVFIALKTNKNGWVSTLLKRLFSSPLSFIIIIAMFIVEAQIFRPETYATYAMTWHGFTLGFLAFLFGFILIHSGKQFWKKLIKLRWVFLFLSVGFFILRATVFDLNAPHYMMATESCIWIFSIFGFTSKHLNQNTRVLSYLSKAAYPIYILHMIFLYLGSSLIFPMAISPWLKLLTVTVFTFTTCFTSYELIKRIPIMKTLFGIKSLNHPVP